MPSGHISEGMTLPLGTAGDVEGSAGRFPVAGKGATVWTAARRPCSTSSGSWRRTSSTSTTWKPSSRRLTELMIPVAEYGDQNSVLQYFSEHGPLVRERRLFGTFLLDFNKDLLHVRTTAITAR